MIWCEPIQIAYTAANAIGLGPASILRRQMIRLGQGLLAAPLRPAARRASRGPRPRRGVRIPFPEEDGTLTPYTFEVGYQLMSLLYDTVMWRDAEGVPRPWLAESVTRSGDGRTVTIRLRDGIRWQDGQPLTASDVGFTFDVRPTPTPVHPQLDDIELVEVVDERTVVITLRRPALGFFDQPLSDLPILPRHLGGFAAGPLAHPWAPVGSGPYELVDRRPGESYVFRANPDYFRGRRWSAGSRCRSSEQSRGAWRRWPGRRWT